VGVVDSAATSPMAALPDWKSLDEQRQRAIEMNLVAFYDNPSPLNTRRALTKHWC
jgi:hypothetical protein